MICKIVHKIFLVQRPFELMLKTVFVHRFSFKNKNIITIQTIVFLISGYLVMVIKFVEELIGMKITLRTLLIIVM